ncbi:hypothetical protein V8C40DRAFT_56233 [Trichoderma camerunense]
MSYSAYFVLRQCLINVVFLSCCILCSLSSQLLSPVSRSHLAYRVSPCSPSCSPAYRFLLQLLLVPFLFPYIPIALKQRGSSPFKVFVRFWQGDAVKGERRKIRSGEEVLRRVDLLKPPCVCRSGIIMAHKAWPCVAFERELLCLGKASRARLLTWGRSGGARA